MGAPVLGLTGRTGRSSSLIIIVHATPLELSCLKVRFYLGILEKLNGLNGLMWFGCMADLSKWTELVGAPVPGLTGRTGRSGPLLITVHTTPLELYSTNNQLD